MDAVVESVAVEHEAAVARTINRILQAAVQGSEEDLGQLCLTVAQELTDSEFGFIAARDESELCEIAISRSSWHVCDMKGRQGHGEARPLRFPPRGLYWEVVNSAATVIADDPSSHPASIGVPPSHPPLSSFLGVPLIDGGVVTGIIAVANRAGGYGPREVEALETLAPAIMTALVRRRAAEQLSRSKQVVDAHMENSPLAIVEFDRDFRVIRWSAVAEEMFGYSADEIVGKSMGDLKWVYEPDAHLVQAESARMFSGEVSRSLNTNRNYRKDGSIIWCEWYSSVVRSERGELQSVMSQVLDVTERYAEVHYREATTEIDRVLHSSLDFSLIAEQAVEVGARAIRADTAAISMYEPEGFVVAYQYGWDKDIRGIVSPKERERHSMLAITTGEPVFVEDPDTDQRVDAELFREWGIRSVAAIPLMVRGEPIAVLYLNFMNELRRFSSVERAFAERLGASLSLALENARLFAAEHRIAETLQETLVVLPAHVAGARFSRAYETATSEKGRVGGDFVDIFEAHGPTVAVAIGDVSGKGIDAAVTTSLVRNTLRVHALDGLPAGTVIEKTNEVVRKFTEVDSFVTVFFGLLNTETGAIRYVCAGHPPAIVVSREGAMHELLCVDPILGAFEDIRYGTHESVLVEGERLVLYSDGITEARAPSGEFLGHDGWVRLLLDHASVPTEILADALMKAVSEFSAGELRDDAAILVVEATRLTSRAGTQACLELE